MPNALPTSATAAIERCQDHKAKEVGGYADCVPAAVSGVLEFYSHKLGCFQIGNSWQLPSACQLFQVDSNKPVKTAFLLSSDS